MIKKINLLVIMLGVLLTSCFKTEEIPILVFDGEANMTIAEFRKLHTLSTTNPATKIESDIIITGLVTSTDKYGSSYRELYFQDTTGGICIRIANGSYYNKYRIGQRIFVKAKDLYLGNYVSGSNTGYYQIGGYVNSNGGMENLPSNIENRHIFRSGLPETPPVPKIITRQTDFNIPTDLLLPSDYHSLVKLVNVRFRDAREDGSVKYFSGDFSTASVRILFNVGGGNGVDARISQYCQFANEPLPTGALNITGILTKFYNDTPQLIICSIDDVEKMPEEKILKQFDMKTNPLQNGWTNVKKIGETVWTYNTGAQNSVLIEAPTGTETECWLVSPKFSFPGEKNVALSLSYRIRNGEKANATVLYSVDGVNWTALNFDPVIGAEADAMLKIPDNVATNPNLQIAFQYKTTAQYPVWMLFGITFKSNVSI